MTDLTTLRECDGPNCDALQHWSGCQLYVQIPGVHGRRRLEQIAADPDGPFTEEEDALVDEALGLTTVEKLQRLTGLPIAELAHWTSYWEEQAYMGKGIPVQRHSDDRPSDGRDLRTGDVGLAFRAWYGHGSKYARVAVMSGAMAGQVIDTLADDWIDALPEAVKAVQHA